MPAFVGNLLNVMDQSGVVGMVGLAQTLMILIGGIDPIGGNGLELDAIAAAVIDGASLFGGRGSIVGTLFGVFSMVFIRNWLDPLNASPYLQGTAIGSIIMAAVLFERLLSGRRSA